MADDEYELLDFGEGRKLERFGPILLDRPCSAAERAGKKIPDLWRTVTARYDRTQGEQGIWTPESVIGKPLLVVFAIDDLSNMALTFRLQPSPFGHVGVFPEQRDNWAWIARQTKKSQAKLGRPLKVLNLFAYTGGSTLAAAAAGAEVVHIDAARNIVERARQNAIISGLAKRSIRWITEDAMKICRRELKRGNHYDAVILDPPSYGHGPKGEPWKIGDDLLPLLTMCGELTDACRAFILVTCHTPGIGPPELAAYLSEGIFGTCAEPPAAGELLLETADGRKLPSGAFARWPSKDFASSVPSSIL
jgi:23S rRNA (cytosine1962-C5)-methyltransferase